MTLSPFNPIYFHKDDTENDAMAGYVHIFATSDRIFFEVLHCDDEEIGDLVLVDIHRQTLTQIGWNTYAINDNQFVSFHELRDMEAGVYQLCFGDYKSNLIRVTADNTELNSTVLIQYCVEANNVRDDVYQTFNGVPRCFELRVPGGFKDSGWSFSVDNEQFDTDKADIVEIRSVEATDKKLTVGQTGGTVSWVGAKIEVVMLCNLILIDGTRYSVIKDARLDMLKGDTYGKKFVYEVHLRQTRFVGAGYERILRAIFRRIPGQLRRSGERQVRKI